jgi:hypothetical protein
MAVTNGTQNQRKTKLLPCTERLGVLEAFCNRWARHDHDCHFADKPSTCTCGFDIALRALSEVLSGNWPASETYEQAIARVRLVQAVIP